MSAVDEYASATDWQDETAEETDDAVGWKGAPDWKNDRIGLETALEAIGWEHTTERTPYDNLAALVEALPDAVEDETIRSIAFRCIAGFGPESTQRALDAYRNRGEGE